MKTYENWRVETKNDVVTLTIDKKDSSANVLSKDLVDEFMDVVIKDVSLNGRAGVVFKSAKPSGFVLGADINEFDNIKQLHEAWDLVNRGQSMIRYIQNLTSTTVAVIDGPALGGGLELALACDYRVASDSVKTKLGLPEVKLGILPGFGGTNNLPKLVGMLAASDMMLTGRLVDTRRAKKIKLVDEVVPARYLDKAVNRLLTRRPKRSLSLMASLPSMWPFRNLVISKMKKEVAKKARKDHYPAPYKIIELLAMGNNNSFDREGERITELVVGNTSKSLVRVFHLSEMMKKLGKGHDHNISHVHVIGAGVMGADIAAVAAMKGFTVTLQDLNMDVLAKANGRAFKLFKKRLKDPKLVNAAMDRLTMDSEGTGLEKADMIVEAVVENLNIKQQIFRNAEVMAKPDCILATNTSSIPLEDIASCLEEPHRLVGLHFFNPVPMMQLVEIVEGKQSSQDYLNRLRAFTVALGKLPLNVKSSPGFLVNRILMPYMMKAVELLEHFSKKEIDQAMLDFGMPMGPITLADTVGLDVCKAVAEELSGPLNMEVPVKLIDLVNDGLLGKKTGEGFYAKDEKPVAELTDSIRTQIADTLIDTMINEALKVINEGVVEHADMVDAGMVFGAGFAPFRGGLMHHHTHNPDKNIILQLKEDLGIA